MHSPLSLFDTHCHLTDPAYADDLDEVVTRAIASGVSDLLTIGLDATSSQECCTIAHKYDQWFAAGIHPSESASVINEETYREIERLLDDSRCVAVGEIGLDFYWPEPPPEPQYVVFRRMLALASQKKFPVVIHQRDSSEQILKELDRFDLPGRGVFHCFGGGPELAMEVVKRGFYISFAGNLTFKKSVLHETIREIPIENLLIETDSPYLSPVPLRGRRNEPANVRFTCTRLAEILEMSVEQVAALTRANARRLFTKMTPT